METSLVFYSIFYESDFRDKVGGSSKYSHFIDFFGRNGGIKDKMVMFYKDLLPFYT
jgi:hypothetical protein